MPDSPVDGSTEHASLPRLHTLRLIDLPGTNGNFRDLGGLRGAGGRVVRHGILFRHGALDALPDSSVAQMEQLRLIVNVDFRGVEECQEKPNRFPAQVRKAHIPIHDGQIREAIYRAMRKGDFSPLQAWNMHQEYARFATENVEEYKDFIHLVLDERNHPLSFSCTAGKDRTGWAAAVIYMVLGVSQASILEDYAASARLLDKWAHEALAQIKDTVRQFHPQKQVDMEPIKQFLTVHPGWLARAFVAVEERWGSVDAYIRDGLGVGGEQQQRFQNAVLEPENGRHFRSQQPSKL